MIDDRKRKSQMSALFKNCQAARDEEHNNLHYEVLRADGVSHMKCRSKAQAISIAKRIEGSYRMI